MQQKAPPAEAVPIDTMNDMQMDAEEMYDMPTQRRIDTAMGNGEEDSYIPAEATRFIKNNGKILILLVVLIILMLIIVMYLTHKKKGQSTHEPVTDNATKSIMDKISNFRDAEKAGAMKQDHMSSPNLGIVRPTDMRTPSSSAVPNGTHIDYAYAFELPSNVVYSEYPAHGCADNAHGCADNAHECADNAQKDNACDDACPSVTPAKLVPKKHAKPVPKTPAKEINGKGSSIVNKMNQPASKPLPKPKSTTHPSPKQAHPSPKQAHPSPKQAHPSPKPAHPSPKQAHPSPKPASFKESSGTVLTPKPPVNQHGSKPEAQETVYGPISDFHPAFTPSNIIHSGMQPIVIPACQLGDADSLVHGIIDNMLVSMTVCGMEAADIEELPDDNNRTASQEDALDTDDVCEEEDADDDEVNSDEDEGESCDGDEHTEDQEDECGEEMEDIEIDSHNGGCDDTHVLPHPGTLPVPCIDKYSDVRECNDIHIEEETEEIHVRDDDVCSGVGNKRNPITSEPDEHAGNSDGIAIALADIIEFADPHTSAVDSIGDADNVDGTDTAATIDVNAVGDTLNTAHANNDRHAPRPQTGYIHHCPEDSIRNGGKNVGDATGWDDMYYDDYDIEDDIDGI
jgi:hypothetical protein